MSLAYSVSNRSDQPIFLFNQLYKDVDDNGRFMVDAIICIVHVENNAVYIGKKILLCRH